MAADTTIAAAGQAATVRYDFLDWLRLLAIGVLLFFHTGMLFVGWGWHITNAEKIPALQLPMDLLHRLRMPLLFVIAGAGMWFALQRRSLAGFARERSLRLLLPAVAGMFIIVPPQVFVERVANGGWHGGYLRFYVERVLQFRAYPAGDFSWHHLWFIVYLFVYVMLLLPLLAWWRRVRPTLVPGPWLLALGIPLGVNEALLKPLFPEAHTLVADWYIFNHYLMLTVYGIALAACAGTWDWLAHRRRWLLGAALLLTLVGLPLLELGIIPRDRPADAVFANLFTWAWLLTFLAWGRRLLSFNNPFLIWAREASYPIYILHQTVIIVIAFFVVRQAWSPWAKYGLILVSTLVVCVLIHEAVLRRFAMTRLLFGIKQKATGQPTKASTPTKA
jgi:glucans biosynthesis protein C